MVTEVDWSVDSASNLSSDKTVRITVSWANPRPGSVSVESSVVGKSTLTNAGDVKINIVDSDTSAKVPGATITIKPSGGLTVSKTTGVDGFVRWGKVPAGSVTITGTCSTHYLDMSPVSGAIVLTGQLNEWTIQAVRPSSGTVHVTDQLGNDLAGVAVTISGPAGSADWSCPTGTGTVTTDANGNAVFPKLRKGTYTVTGALANYAVEASPPTLNVIAGGSSYTSQLRMDRLTNIRVTVVDSSNNPISGCNGERDRRHLRRNDQREWSGDEQRHGRDRKQQDLHRDRHQDRIPVQHRYGHTQSVHPGNAHHRPARRRRRRRSESRCSTTATTRSPEPP